jgi:hypothetical protein
MKKLTLLTLAIGAAAITHAQAVTSNTNQTVTLTLQNKIDIAVEGSPSGLSFTFASAADYSTGLTNLNASQFRVRSNQSFAVTVAAATADFSSASTTVMPASKLGVRLNGSSGAFTSLSTSSAALTTGTRGGNNLFAVDYNANPGYDYDAGTYTLSVVYTATQQ